MKEREVWDAVDAAGRPLGFDLYRDEAEQIPDGVYHRVVEIYVVTKQQEFLTTLRDPRKPFGLMWEITGGSVLKGESSLAGAVRELREETGIVKRLEELTLLTQMPVGHTLYDIYITTVPDRNIPITLQPGETVDYRFLARKEFMHEIYSECFAGTIGERLTQYKLQLDAYLDALK